MADRVFEEAHNSAGHRSVTEIVQNIADNLQEIIRSEFQLAKVEMTERGKAAARSAGLLAGGLALLAFAGVLVIVAGIAAMALAMPVWLACLIMTVLLAIVGGGMAIVGRQRLQQSRLRPDETIQSVKEDVEWVKQQTR